MGGKRLSYAKELDWKSATTRLSEYKKARTDAQQWVPQRSVKQCGCSVVVLAFHSVALENSSELMVIQNVGFQACTNLTYAQHFQAFLHTYSMNCFKTFTQFCDSDLTVMFFYWLIKKAMILTLILTWCTPSKGLYSADNSPELPLLSFDFFFFSQLGFKDGALSCKVLLGSHILNTYHVSQHDCLTKSVTWPQLCTKEWSWMSAAYQMPAWDVWL